MYSRRGNRLSHFIRQRYPRKHRLSVCSCICAACTLQSISICCPVSSYRPIVCPIDYRLSAYRLSMPLASCSTLIRYHLVNVLLGYQFGLTMAAVWFHSLYIHLHLHLCISSCISLFCRSMIDRVMHEMGNTGQTRTRNTTKPVCLVWC